MGLGFGFQVQAQKGISMIYVKRSEQGEITQIEFSPAPGFEQSNLFDPEINTYLQSSAENSQLIKEVLDRVDLEMGRVLEDLIDVLVDKGVMNFTDLPEPVQNKLLFKKSLRNALHTSYALPDEIPL